MTLEFCLNKVLLQRLKINATHCDIRELSVLTGVNAPTLKKLLANKRSGRLQTYLRICDNLGCTLNELVKYK